MGWVDESYKKMSTTSSQICELKDFELMDNFVFRCYHARGQTDSFNTVIAKQFLLPNENDPSGSCNSKTEFIPPIALYVYSLYISDDTCTWLTLPGVIFRKWHVRMHSYRSK